ncbi:hypothetical protein [Sphingobium terrigena]|uniref:hypothetical protein n=1 Tax=Sphingobium terrigena TaxID=2304063 RepID=UPI001EEFCD59|nr:hypothetical protein [Sphingobium terrigena]
MIGPACIGLAGSPGLAIVLFCVGGFAHQMLNRALITPLIGQSADIFGYSPLFVMLGALDIIGMATLWLLLRNRPSIAAA